MSRKPLVAIVLGVGLALLVSVWLSIAPMTLGGSVQYVTTSGDSMAPAFREGDLALLKERERYAPGDVVAFEHPELGMILHRIVRTDGDEFVVKGDNNQVEDSYTPSSNEIVGSVWTRIPYAGGLLESMASRWMVVVIAAALGIFTLIPLGIVFPAGALRRRRWLPRISPSIPHIQPERVAFLLGRPGQFLITLLAFLAVAGLALAFVAYNHPLDRSVTVLVEYRQHANLGYSALADGDVYTDGVVLTGDPVYRELVDELIFTLDYEIESDRAVSGDGAYWMNVRIEGSDGWQRTLSLREQTPYTGTEATDTAVLPLARIDEAIEDFHSETGVDATEGMTFTVHVQAGVSFNGNVGDEVIHTFADDVIALDWDSQVLYPTETPATDATESATDTVDVTESRANTVGLGATTVSVRTARMIAQVLLFLAVLGGVVVWLLMRRALQTSEIVQIAARYRSRIVPIQGARIPSPARVVALLSFDDLMRIADQKQEPILYLIHKDVHYYYVHAADVIYRVRIEDVSGQHSLQTPSGE